MTAAITQTSCKSTLALYGLMQYKRMRPRNAGVSEDQTIYVSQRKLSRFGCLDTSVARIGLPKPRRKVERCTRAVADAGWKHRGWKGILAHPCEHPCAAQKQGSFGSDLTSSDGLGVSVLRYLGQEGRYRLYRTTPLTSYYSGARA